MPIPAWAQPAAVAPAAATPRALNIPPQALDTALTALADQAGLKLLFASQDVAGLRTSGLVGSFAPAEALGRLLAGTGLTYRFTDATTVTLERLPQRSDAGSDAVHLPPVQVQGESAPETAFGPGKGYVAHQNSTGTKTDTPLLETPQSVSVVTRQQMDDQNAQRVSQALRYTTGVVPE
jgi:iron complex outermembrane receptor protein